MSVTVQSFMEKVMNFIDGKKKTKKKILAAIGNSIVAFLIFVSGVFGT